VISLAKENTPRTIAWVNKEALRHNFQVVRSAAPAAKISAVVKDNAYGHGVELVVEALCDLADGFSVATVEEAVVLRKIGVNHPIWVLTGFDVTDELQQVQEFELTPIVHSQHQVDLIKKLDEKIRIILEVDTGMGRLGFSSDQFQTVMSSIPDRCEISSVMSHFSSADDLRSENTRIQLDKFLEITANLQFDRSIANSAGILGWPESHCQWVRPGLAIYGISPFLNDEIGRWGLSPAMRLESRLIALRDMQSGDTVGYGGEWVCPSTMRVGVVGCGYGDGYPRGITGKAQVFVKGQRTSVIGRVSMDSLVIDLRGIENAQVGDPVELWGDRLRVEIVAENAGTIANDLVTRVATRVRRKATPSSN
jgi:alanine racemase